MQLLNKDGKPIKLDIKTILLYTVLSTGLFTAGSANPNLNPLDLIKSEPCQNG